jgi:hypothetical protein
MMRQNSLTGFEKYTKKTSKEQLWEDMDRDVRRSELTQALKAYYLNLVGSRSRRRPKGLERMLRIYFMPLVSSDGSEQVVPTCI